MLLPLAVFGLLAYMLMRRGDTTRQAVLRSAVFTASLLVAITEVVSVPHLLTRGVLVLSWSVAAIVLVCVLIRQRKVAEQRSLSSERLLLHAPSSLTPIDITLACIIAFCLACVGLVAIVAPPNSWDSMEHHLPRIMFWVSNHGVGVYPTPDFAQLLKGPGSEFISLHGYLLWGNDRLVNLVEFLSFAGCGLGASLIASKLGAGRVGQFLAVLFVVTIPEAILESSGAMTTAVASFWAVSACYFLVQAGKMSDEWDVVAAALATGLARLTDPISFHSLPVALLACVLFRPSTARLWLLRRLPLFVVLALAVNAGQFVRAYQVTGHVFGSPFPEGGPRLDFSNERIAPTAIAANVLRQASLQIGTPSNKLNLHTESAVRRLIHILGQDPDDPGASWSGFPFYMDHPTRLETQAGNPVHFLIAVVCILAAFVLRPGHKDRRVLWLGGGIILSFVVYSALVRWQPWGSRFHLPLFVLSAGIVGLVAERLFKRSWMVLGFAAMLLVVALPYLVSNSVRSIIATKGFPTIFQPREQLYFGDQHMALAQSDLAMAKAIKDHSCGSVALDAYLPIPESEIRMSPTAYFIYPFLAELGIDGKSRRVHYIDVNDSTKRFASPTNSGQACAVVCLTCRLSHGAKSDARLGETQVFGQSELVFPAPQAP